MSVARRSRPLALAEVGSVSAAFSAQPMRDRKSSMSSTRGSQSNSGHAAIRVARMRFAESSKLRDSVVRLRPRRSVVVLVSPLVARLGIKVQRMGRAVAWKRLTIVSCGSFPWKARVRASRTWRSRADMSAVRAVTFSSERAGRTPRRVVRSHSWCCRARMGMLGAIIPLAVLTRDCQATWRESF